MASLVFAVSMLGIAQHASAAYAALYGGDGNDFYTFTGSSSVANLKSSGWNGLLMFAVSVQSNGDIKYGGNTIVTGGSYVGNSSWGANVTALKTAPTTIYRYEVCVGGWGDASFTNIKNLIASQGTGSTSILYKNFHALRAAVPGIDAINDDDEQTYDASSTVSFANMLGGMGYKFTIAPYLNPTYWTSVKGSIGGLCDIVYLQCYSGGAGNDPGSWSSTLGITVTPGIESNNHSQTTFANWYSSDGIRNGFYWPDVTWTPTSNWGSAEILNGIGFHSGLYTLANDNSGLSLAPEAGGTGNGTQLVQYHLGASNDFRWNVTYQSALGFWEISGASSGRAATISGDSMADSAPIVLWDYTADHDQLFAFVNKPGGYFRCQFVHSGLSMVISGASTASGADVVQYNNDNAANAWWQFRQFQIPGTPGS